MWVTDEKKIFIFHNYKTENKNHTGQNPYIPELDGYFCKLANNLGQHELSKWNPWNDKRKCFKRQKYFKVTSISIWNYHYKILIIFHSETQYLVETAAPSFYILSQL